MCSFNLCKNKDPHFLITHIKFWLKVHTFRIFRRVKIICQKKSHAKSFHPIRSKLNQTNLHTSGLILIPFEVNWTKSQGVLFFFDKLISLGTFFDPCALFFYQMHKNQWNQPKLDFSDSLYSWCYDTNQICLIAIKFRKFWFILDEKNHFFKKNQHKLSFHFFFWKFKKIVKFKTKNKKITSTGRLYQYLTLWTVLRAIWAAGF